MDLYSLLAARAEGLGTGGESSQVDVEGEAAVTHPAPAPDGKSAFQAIIVTWMWVLSQHLPSCYTDSVGKYNNTLINCKRNGAIN